MIAVFPAASMLPEHIAEANANALLASAAEDMLSIMPDIMAMLDDPANKHEMKPYKKAILRKINDLCESFRVK